MAEELWVKLKADIDDVKNKLGKITSEGNKTASTLGSSFQKLGGIIAGAFTVGALVKFASDSLKAFTDTERSALSLAHALKTIGMGEEGIKSIEKAVNNLERLTAFDDADIRRSLQNLIFRFGDVDFALKVLPVAMEAARAKGVDLASMTDGLSLGLQGSTRQLRQFGITNIEGKSRLEILESVSRKVTGSMSEFANTTAGSTEIMRTSFGNLQEMAGGVVSPLFVGFNEELSEMIINSLAGAESMDRLGSQLRTIGGVVANLIGTVAWAGGVFVKFGMLVGAVIDGMLRPKTFRKWIDDIKKQAEELFWHPLKLIDMWADVGEEPKKTTGIAEYLNELNKLKTGIKGIGEEVEGTGDKISDAFKPAWQPISLLGGNLPELSKFIGNLRYAQPVITKKVLVEVRVADTSRVATATSKAVVKEIKTTVQEAWAPTSHGTGRWW